MSKVVMGFSSNSLKGDAAKLNTNANPVEIQFTIRDFYQSVTGPVVVDDVLASIKNIRDYGIKRVQAGGGTWHDLLVSKGINPYEYVKAVCDHLGDDIEKSALIRGHVGFGYEVQPPDVLEYTIKRYAECGINVFQSFHAMNDCKEMMYFVPQITGRLREERGFNVRTQGGICIQRNPSGKIDMQTMLDRISWHAEDLVKSGHEDFYVKNANGDLELDFVSAVFECLSQRFDERTFFHTHDTWGFGVQSCKAAIEAGAYCVDVLSDTMGGTTAQPNLGMLVHVMKHSDSETLRTRVPQGINFEAINSDAIDAILVRGRRFAGELKFRKSLLNAGYAAGAAGGAFPALRDMDMTAMLAQRLGCDLDLAHELIYWQEAKNREALGYPTNVTPHANFQDLQGCNDITPYQTDLTADNPRDMVAEVKSFKVIAPPVGDYLVGRLGKVSEDVDPELQKRALEEAGLDKVVELEPIENLPPGMPKAKEALIKAGKKNPTQDEISFVASCRDGLKFVMGEIEPLKTKEPHPDFQEGGLLHGHGDLEAAIYSIVYGMMELKRVRIGYHASLDNQEEYADKLEANVNDILERLSDYLKEEKVDLEVARCVNKHLTKMAKELGLDAKGVPDFVKKPTGVEVTLSDMPQLDGFAFNNFSSKTKLVSGLTPKGKETMVYVDRSFKNAPVPPQTKQRVEEKTCATSSLGIIGSSTRNNRWTKEDWLTGREPKDSEEDPDLSP